MKSFKKNIYCTSLDSDTPIACPDVTIGSQIWTGCNLNVDTYRNGDPIPQVTDPTAWASLTTGAWCYYNNDSANGPTYGKLYNWYAVNDPRGLAPVGYHIPTNVEYNTLITTLGGTLIAGGPLKETGTTHWTAPNTGATDSTGFTALPGGFRLNDGVYYELGLTMDNWTSTDIDINTARVIVIYNNNAGAYTGAMQKERGLSIRLIKD
jgi:uncharacterized protein (TIGR02145 family)